MLNDTVVADRSFRRHVRARQRAVIVFLAGAYLLGCTATYKGGSSTSPDGRYRVAGHVRGAYGRAFDEYSKKKVTVGIYDVPANMTRAGERKLFERRYVVVGSDVGWDATWGGDGRLTFVVYDYGPGVDRWAAKKQGWKSGYFAHLITASTVNQGDS